MSNSSIPEYSPRIVQPCTQDKDRTGAPQAPIPSALRTLPVWGVRKGKVPHQARDPRYGASSTNPTHWDYLNIAQQVVDKGLADGLGSVMAEDLGMVFIDLDHCFDDAGQLKPHAAEIVDMLPTHWHVSMSSKGLHGICYGHIPAAVKNSSAGIEMYASGRYIAWPTDVRLFGKVTEITDCSDAVTILYERLRPSTASTEASTAMPAVSGDLADVIQRMQQYERTDRLLRGDASGYPGYSEARYALGCSARFWNLGESDIATVLRHSGLFKPDATERDRDRRAAYDAAQVCKNYTGPYYDPNHQSHRDIRLILPNDAPDATTDDVPDNLEDLRAELARARAHRDAYKAAYETMRAENEAVAAIVRIEDMDTSTRIAMIGVLYMGLEFQRANKPQTKIGYHMPASWIGRKCGLKPQTVNRQLKRASEAGLIDRQVVPVTQIRTVELVDSDGVMETDTYESRGQQSYITLPANVIDIVPRLTAYQKPADAPKRGGARVAGCKKHPEAQLIRRTAYYCEGCYHEAVMIGAPLPKPVLLTEPTRAQRMDIEPAEDISGIKLESDIVDTVSIGAIKLAPETTSPQRHISNLNRDMPQEDGDYPIVPRCDWHLGEGEECGEPTETWEHQGYGNTVLCARHAEKMRKSVLQTSHVTTVSRALRGEVAS